MARTLPAYDDAVPVTECPACELPWTDDRGAPVELEECPRCGMTARAWRDEAGERR